MLKAINNLSKVKLLRIIAILITLSVLGLSLIKMPETGLNVKNIDKAYHSFAYFTLTIVWLLSFYKSPQKKYIVTIGCIIFGIIIEVLQMKLTSYRTGDLLDVFANSFGSITALLIFSMIFKKK